MQAQILARKTHGAPTCAAAASAAAQEALPAAAAAAPATAAVVQAPEQAAASGAKGAALAPVTPAKPGIEASEAGCAAAAAAAPAQPCLEQAARKAGKENAHGFKVAGATAAAAAEGPITPVKRPLQQRLAGALCFSDSPFFHVAQRRIVFEAYTNTRLPVFLMIMHEQDI